MLMLCVQWDHTFKHASEDLINITQQAAEHDLTISGKLNATYMHLELMLSQIMNKKMQLKDLEHSLEEEVIHLQT